MPKGCDKYPKDRVTYGPGGSGSVKQGNKPISNGGSEHMKTGRAGKSK